MGKHGTNYDEMHIPAETTFKDHVGMAFKQAVDYREESKRLRAALERINAIPPGSSGAYRKFAEAKMIAREALEQTGEKK